MTDGSNPALVTFAIYMVGVFALAWLSNRVGKERSFVGEYFLGSRSLGVWAFALTFAATSASGGSFVGFPALIYTHGWSMALWISGYMMVPLLAMGLLGKRLNHISRQTDAVTIPDVMRERFGSVWAGLVATLLIVVFIFYYLLAQFKAGSEILVSLLRGAPLYDAAVALTAQATSRVSMLDGTDAEYLLCLAVFAGAVIIYVVYGGFRAVVWTDVMQGIIMFVGVLIMLALAVHFTGGLRQATLDLAERTPPAMGQLNLRFQSPDGPRPLPKGVWVRLPNGRLARTLQPYETPVADALTEPQVEALILTNDADCRAVPADQIVADVSAELRSEQDYAYGASQPGVYLRLPGPSSDQLHGFMSLGMMLSFFIFWPFGSSGQPANMVRLMAFRDTRTLRRSIMTVAVYYSVIYCSLVVVFCCARVMMPGMEREADRVMPQMAVLSTERAGVPWLAGLLLAAPFAAVMSSVDSFLLVVSSALVRDLYQRHLRPDATERQLQRVTYVGTVVVGVLAALAAIHPPQYLQDIIIRASGGLAASFLVPMAFALYWRRMTASGAIAGMLTGCLTHFLLSFGADQANVWIPTYLRWLAGQLTQFGLEPFIWDLLFSTIAVIAVSLISPRPDDRLAAKFFPRN